MEYELKCKEMGWLCVGWDTSVPRWIGFTEVGFDRLKCLIWLIFSRERGLQSVESCFRDFPDQCKGCPEYREKRYDSGLQLISTSTMGVAYPSQYRSFIVKECKRYHKRTVEPLEQ